jgi:hypothetical protein
MILRSFKPRLAFDRFDAGLTLGFALYLYANLFARPGTPYLLGGDQVYFWTYAQRLLYGEQVYRDFFQFTPPGTDLLYLGVFKLLGPRIWTTNLVVLLLDASLCLLCLRMARLLMPLPQAALAACLYLVFVAGATLDGSHHWLSALTALSAVLVLMRETTSTRIAIAGALLGLATFFTQTTGPVAAIAIAAWLMWQPSRATPRWWGRSSAPLLLFASLIVTWLALSGYYIATLGVGQLWFFQVSYVRDYMVTGWHAAAFALPAALPVTARSSLALRWLFAYAVLPASYAIAVWKCWRLSRQARTEYVARLALLTAVGAAMFLEMAGSPNWFRIFAISLPGVILLIWLLAGLGQLSRYARHTLWIALIALAAYQTWSKHRLFSTIEQLPAGRVATTASNAEKLRWVAVRTEPGQFLLQAQWPGMYLPLALRNPVFLDNLGDDGADALGYLALSMRQLDARQVPYIIEPATDSAPALRQYLAARYRLVWRFSDLDEVWERRPSTSVADD